MQKHVNIVDLVKSFPTNMYLQKLASIQQRTPQEALQPLFGVSLSNASTEKRKNMAIKKCVQEFEKVQVEKCNTVQ